MLVGTGLEVYVLVRKLSGDQFREHIAAIIVGVLLIVVGVQLVATGLIGEMITAQGQTRGRAVQESRRE